MHCKHNIFFIMMQFLLFSRLFQKGKKKTQINHAEIISVNLYHNNLLKLQEMTLFTQIKEFRQLIHFWKIFNMPKNKHINNMYWRINYKLYLHNLVIHLIVTMSHKDQICHVFQPSLRLPSHNHTQNQATCCQPEKEMKLGMIQKYFSFVFGS